MGISLLDDLQQGDYDAAFFLTYTLNLTFFEWLVLPRLRRLGVARIGILTDEKGYQESLDDPMMSEACGRTYIVDRARLPGGGIQHAKVLWLTGHRKGREHVAYVGSHNLTMAGYNDQAEVTVRLSSSEPGHVQGLRNLHAAITGVIPPSLYPVWQHIPSPPPTTSPRTVWALTSRDEPLADQLVRLVREAEHLRVVTPFLDSGALHRLATGVGARTVTLDIPAEGTDTPLQAALDLIPGLQARAFAGKRRLHAKAYTFRSPDQTWLALGSANCTQAALEKSVRQGGNLEVLVVGQGTELPVYGEPSLPEPFVRVDEAATYPGTGRNWDEGRPSRAPVAITRADYIGGQLEVEWTWEGPPIAGAGGDETCLLQVQGTEASFACATSPAAVPLARAPRRISLTTGVGDGARTVCAWVTDHAALEEFASGARAHRWVEALASQDPMQHATAIGAWLEQGVLELLHGEFDHEPIRGNAPQPAQGQSQAAHARDMLGAYREVFAFSPDPVAVRATAERFLRSGLAGDPLAILRALLDRSTAPANTEGAGGAAAEGHSARHEQRREAAQRQIAQSLIRHLEHLAREDQRWESAPERTITDVLRLTWGAVASIGYEVVRHAVAPPVRMRLVDAYLSLLRRLAASSRVRVFLAQSSVAGPLALSLGVIADLAGSVGDRTMIGRLRKLAIALLGNDPGATLTTWRTACKDQADTLLAATRGTDLYPTWEALAFSVWGIASEPARRRLHERWGLLLALQDADVHHAPESETLYADAAAKYGTSSVWRLYCAARSRGKLPVVQEVATWSVCPKCHLHLPDAKARALMRGDAVICDECRTILVLRTR